MAEDTPSTPALRDEHVFDLDALAPPPESRFRVRVRGAEYPIRQMAQLTGDEEMDLTRLEQAILRGTTDEHVRRAMFDKAAHLVRVLVPTMPEGIRRGLQYIEMIAVANHAWAYARLPPTAAVPPLLADTATAPRTVATGSPSAEANLRPVSADSSAAIPDA